MACAKPDRADILIDGLMFGATIAPADAAVAGRELIMLLDDDVDTMLVCAPQIEPRYPEVALALHEAIVGREPETLATLMAITEHLRICHDRNDPAGARRVVGRALTLASQWPYPQLRDRLDALRRDPAFASLFDD